MKNRQFILGLLLIFMVIPTTLALSIAIKNENIIFIIIHCIATIVYMYNGIKLIKKTI